MERRCKTAGFQLQWQWTIQNILKITDMPNFISLTPGFSRVLKMDKIENCFNSLSRTLIYKNC